MVIASAGSCSLYHCSLFGVKRSRMFAREKGGRRRGQGGGGVSQGTCNDSLSRSMANQVIAVLTACHALGTHCASCMTWQVTKNATRYPAHEYQSLTLAFEALRRTESMPPMMFRKVS